MSQPRTLLEAALHYAEQHGHPPSIDWIDEVVDFRQPGGIHRLKEALQESAARHCAAIARRQVSR
jgi:SOS-response transcriptional repressor LexA